MIRLFLIGAAATIAAAACTKSGTPDADPFATYQLCFDEHTMMESLTSKEAIVVCCLDHPIAGQKVVCKDTEADCETYLRAQLSSATTAAQITEGCTEYITQKSM